jgi:hypothetical protein
MLWGAVVSITGSLIPMAVVLRGVKQGRWDSHHVTTREHRLVPFLVALASVSGSWLIVGLGGAPRQMNRLMDKAGLPRRTTNLASQTRSTPVPGRTTKGRSKY